MKRALSILLVALLVLFALPAAADDEAGLKTGLYTSDAGTGLMYLFEQGVGVLVYPVDGQFYFNGVVWTEDSLEIERTNVPFALTEDVLSFTYEEVAMALRYKDASDAYALGDRNGTAFAGTYSSEDGKKLALTADGRGVFTTAADESQVFWGSFMAFAQGMEGQTEGSCYILFDSYLGELVFENGTVVVHTEAEGNVTLHPDQVENPAMMTVVSPAFDLCIDLPTDRWIVKETENGLMVYRTKDLIQYTFLSLVLGKAPDLATLDVYTDHVWKDSLMGAGVAYDAGETIRDDIAIGQTIGRTAATEWTRDGAEYMGDSVLWYANGRLYAALCVSTQDTRDEALALLKEVLVSFRTAAEAENDWENQLPVDKESLGNIEELPSAPAAPVEEQVYYGYRATRDGEAYDLLAYMSSMGMDPRSICLILRADGTGSFQIVDEQPVAFTWTDKAFSAQGMTIPYTRQGDHILFAMGKETIEFAPASEVDVLLGDTSAEKGSVVPTAEVLVGSWTLTKTKILGTEVPADQKNTTLSLVFNENGSAIELVDGTPNELEWTIREDGKVSLTEAGNEKYVLTYDGTVLTVDAGTNSVEMIFEKDV